MKSYAKTGKMSSLILLTGLFLVCLVTPLTSSLTGGIEPAKVDEEGVVRAAKFATDEINKMSNALHLSKMTSVVEAKKQVVSGMNYFLTIEITETKCKKNDQIDDLESCKLLDKPLRQNCEVVVYEQVWKTQNPQKLTKFSCDKVED